MISEKINPLVRDEGPSGSVGRVAAGRVAAPPATIPIKVATIRKIRGMILHESDCFTINILISCTVMDLKHRRRRPEPGRRHKTEKTGRWLHPCALKNRESCRSRSLLIWVSL